MKYFKISAALLIIGLAVVLYLPTINYDFVYDDYTLIVNNHDIQEFNVESIKTLFFNRNTVNFLPARMFVYALIYHYNQLNPVPYHIVNIILHALNSLLVFGITCLIAGGMGRNGKGAETAGAVFAGVVAALIFAAHPLHVEAVTWVSGLKDVLSTFFCLAGFIAYLTYRIKGDSGGFRAGYMIALIAFIFAVLSKATALPFPFALLFFDIIFAETARRTELSQRIQEHVFLFIVMGGLFTLNYVMAQKNLMIENVVGGGMFLHVLTIVKIIPFYLLKIIWPVDLSIIYDIPAASSLLDPAVIISLLALVLLTAFIIYFRKRNPALSFGTGFFVIMLGPTLNVIPFGTLAADRYVYLPLFGICLAAGVVAGEMFDRGVVPRAVAAALVIVVGAGMIYGVEKRNPDWRDPISLWESTVETVPESAKALASLGGAYLREKRFDDAMNVFRRALKADKTFPATYVGMGLYYLTKNENMKALNILQEGLKYGSGNINLLYHIGIAYYNLGEYLSAVRVFAAVDSAKPNYKSVGRYMQLTLSELKKELSREDFMNLIMSIQM